MSYKFLFLYCYFTILFNNFSSATIVQLTKDNFKQNVEEQSLPVLIKISATWCPNCIKFDQMMLEVVDFFHDRCVFANIDIDKQQNFLQEFLQDIFQKYFYIMSGFPCILVFFKGRFKQSFLGFFANTKDLSNKITEIIVAIDD